MTITERAALEELRLWYIAIDILNKEEEDGTKCD